MTPKLRYFAALLVAGALLLAACSATTPGAPQPEPIELQGLWLVEPDAGTAYGAGGTTTLEFGAAPTGTATFLSLADANDVTTCASHVYAALSEHVVLLDGEYYQATAVGADRIDLVNEDASLMLTRVTGAPPVAPCTAASSSELQRFTFGVGNWSTLDAHQTRLYFNVDDTGNPIVAYDTATGVLGAQRTYGGFHDNVVAARSDDEFYGHCACGNITSLERFDISVTPALATVDTQADLGYFLSIRYGFFAAGSVVIGGHRFDAPDVNTLLTLNAATLALQSQRDVLPGAFIRDMTPYGGGLAALVRESIVIVGADGRADQTIALDGAVGGFPRGLAAIGSTFYVLAETNDDDAVLFEVTVP